MKKIKICILSCLSVFILTSCELNIVPDNIPTIEDHAFALRKEAEKSCLLATGICLVTEVSKIM